MHQQWQQNHRVARELINQLIVLFLAIVFGCCGVVYGLPSQEPVDSVEPLVEYLTHEKNDLMRLNNDVIVSAEQDDLATLLLKIKQNEATRSLVHANIAVLEGFLANQRQQQKQLAVNIKRSTLASTSNQDPLSASQHLALLTEQMAATHKTIALITENLALAHRYEATLTARYNQLLEWKEKKQSLQQLQDLHHQIDKLEQDRSILYQHNVQLKQAKATETGFNQTYDDDIHLQLNNQAIALINDQISVLQLQIKLIRTGDYVLKQQDIKTIQLLIDTYKEAIDDLAQIDHSLHTMLDLLKGEQAFLVKSETKQRLLALQHKAEDFLKRVITYQQQLSVSLDEKQQQLKTQLSVRQTLAAYQANGWLTIKAELSQVIPQLNNYQHVLWTKASEGYWQLTLVTRVGLGLSLVGIFLFSLWFSRLLKRLTLEKTRSRLSAHLYDGFLVVLARNGVQLGLLAMLLLAFISVHLPMPNYQLIVKLYLLWLMFRNLILIAQLILLENEHNVLGIDVRLFYRLKRLLQVGGFITGMMMISQQIPLSMLIQDLFTRLFMLFIFASSIVLWAGKEVFPLLLRPLLKAKKRYLKNAVSLIFILLPLTLFTTAIIGLVGYMNLAWTMSRYQGYLVLVVVGYVLVRGLVADVLELLSEWMIESMSNGWLWIEVIIKPLDKIIHLLLFLISVMLLCELFGVYMDMPVLLWLKHVGDHELVNVSGVHITLISVLEFIIVLSVFIWAAKWTREFCYRWLYRHSRDDGVRNSLSVFTQYAVILLGGYITLRVLGLDFSGMSMILGGLAVGMGFGLRDFASNIVGGIMLLIERPVREGDVITIGAHEGRVAHIGIRSMRVSSWDNTEVLIPNAETFNKPFINWTHQDSVVRTVIPIKLSRADDPTLIQQLIYDVLAIIPEILDEPAPQVLFTQIDEALIGFEIRYFINIQRYTRFEIRSKVLFALMAQFKAAGVSPPIPPLHIDLVDSGSKP